MYQVGGKQGEVYNNDQGKGLATELSSSVGKAFETLLKYEIEKKESYKKALNKIQESVPEFWVNYSVELGKQKDKLIQEAADIMARKKTGDIFNSLDQEAIDWTKRWTKFLTDASSSMQIKKLYEERLKDINNPTNLGKYTEESVTQVVNFPYSAPMADVLSGKVQVPILKLKEPGAELFKSAASVAKELKTENIKNMSENELLNMALLKLSENSPQSRADLEGQLQLFYSLTPEKQNEYKNRAINLGYTQEIAGAALMFAESVKSFASDEIFDYGEFIANAAKEAPQDKTSNKNSVDGISISRSRTSLADSEYPMLQAKSAVATSWPSMSRNATLLEEAKTSMQEPIAVQQKKVTDYLAKKIKDNITVIDEREYVKSETRSNKEAKKAAAQTFYRRISMFDAIARGEDANTYQFQTALAELNGKEIAKGFYAVAPIYDADRAMLMAKYSNLGLPKYKPNEVWFYVTNDDSKSAAENAANMPARRVEKTDTKTRGKATTLSQDFPNNTNENTQPIPVTLPEYPVENTPYRLPNGSIVMKIDLASEGTRKSLTQKIYPDLDNIDLDDVRQTKTPIVPSPGDALFNSFKSNPKK